MSTPENLRTAARRWLNALRTGDPQAPARFERAVQAAPARHRTVERPCRRGAHGVLSLRVVVVIVVLAPGVDAQAPPRSGIISLPGSRGPYFYRASKTALNMVMRVLADDLRSKGVIVALVSPPPTDTEMLRTLIGPQGAAQQARPEASVTGMIKVIAGLSAAQSGGPPIYFDGTTLPW